LSFGPGGHPAFFMLLKKKKIGDKVLLSQEERVGGKRGRLLELLRKGKGLMLGNYQKRREGED